MFLYQVPDSESAFDAATAVVAGSSPTALWSSVVQSTAQALRHHCHPHPYQHRSVGVDHLSGSHLQPRGAATLAVTPLLQALVHSHLLYLQPRYLLDLHTNMTPMITCTNRTKQPSILARYLNIMRLY